MPDCFWVLSFKLNFFWQEILVLDNQIYYSACLKDMWIGKVLLLLETWKKIVQSQHFLKTKDTQVFLQMDQ